MKAEIIVQGVVQGVGYRFFVLNQARLYDVKGYVKNMPDGTVQVLAEGKKGMVKDFVERLRIGPLSAHVTGIDVKWHEKDSGFTEFRLQY
jgi:acylphosphatase